jgi:hypothetical protein
MEEEGFELIRLASSFMRLKMSFILQSQIKDNRPLTAKYIASRS